VSDFCVGEGGEHITMDLLILLKDKGGGKSYFCIFGNLKMKLMKKEDFLFPYL